MSYCHLIRAVGLAAGILLLLGGCTALTEDAAPTAGKPAPALVEPSGLAPAACGYCNTSAGARVQCNKSTGKYYCNSTAGNCATPCN